MGKLPRVTVAGIPGGFEERQYTTGDVTMNYVAGPENGPALLLIPGQMEAWQGYKFVLSELSRRFHVFVPDLRGHGKSTWTPGRYSYNICGNDLKCFLKEVIGRPAFVAGLSSGAVLAVWLAAYAPEHVLAIVSEDPPIFSSIWPRIQNEKYLYRTFKVAVDTLGKPGERDLEGYFMQMGAPARGKDDLMMIPPFFVKIIMGMYRLNRALSPKTPYDVPLLPYYMRAGFKFFSEYDTGFSRATIDGDLSKDFDPEDALRRVQCPMLLLRADAYRHETWGILGAMDDGDLERVRGLVKNLQVVQIGGRHDIHVANPARYIAELTHFVDDVRHAA